MGGWVVLWRPKEAHRDMNARPPTKAARAEVLALHGGAYAQPDGQSQRGPEAEGPKTSHLA